jgi:hypothetical protein
VPYVPPSEDAGDAEPSPAPPAALRGIFGEVPPPRVFGSVTEPMPAADGWAPRVAAPLQPRTPRWYRANPYGFAWAALWSLPLPALGLVQAARTGEVSPYLGGAVVGVWASSTVVVGAAAYFSKHHWRWWLAYPAGVVLVAALRILIRSVTAAS